MKKLLLFVVLLLIGGVYFVFVLGNPSPGPNKVRVVVPKGSTVENLADTLYRRGLLRSKFSFDIAARATKLSKYLLAGAFEITPGGSNIAIAEQFKGTAHMVELQLTIPEGSTMYRAAGIASRQLGVDSAAFIAAATDRKFLDSLKLPSEATSAEGYLFPDTYTFLNDPSPTDIVATMVHKWKKVLTDSVMAEIKRKNWTLHRFMTFASIVESEARRPEERDTIAGVYGNRLRIGMKLDADPTVQYGLGLNRPITHQDLLKDTPYNTYRNPGLPPGPVNNPGRAAIDAALHPVDHKFLYFVARRDGSGGHYFSESIEGQNQNINRAKRNAAGSQ